MQQQNFISSLAHCIFLIIPAFFYRQFWQQNEKTAKQRKEEVDKIGYISEKFKYRS